MIARPVAFVPFAPLLALLFAAGCADPEPLTQVTARIYVEPQVVSAMRSVRLRLSTLDGDTWTERELVVVPGASIERFPIDVPITPRAGKAGRTFELVVDALDGAEESLVQARAITGFVEGEVRVLELWLEVCGDQPLRTLCESDPGCSGTACAVCVGGACQANTEITPVQTLLPLEGAAPDADKPNPVRRADAVTDGCGDMPCEHGGSCAPAAKGDTFICSCPAGYEGERCETANPCNVDPCDNGGTCTATSDTAFECACPGGYEGERCQTANPCNVDPCDNGGTCTATSDTAFECACPGGYEGERCETANPCNVDPCDNGGACTATSDTDFECACVPGFIGDTCATACAFTAVAAPAADDEDNLVEGAALYMGSQWTSGAPATCDGACRAAHAADGQRCGEVAKVPLAIAERQDAGELWMADWSAGGARRIDRIEIYNAIGAEGAALGDAEIRVDDFPVGTFPPGAVSHALHFDPPIYGSSVQLVAAAGPMAVAEVEVWGKRGPALTNVALHGAVRQSSVLATSEAITAGGMANAGATNAADGRFATVASTKPFLRGGSTDLESLVQGQTAAAYPYGTGNQDEVPLVGRDDAWWYLDLGRGQRVHAVHIHRGEHPARLAGAEVYVSVGGIQEADPRFTLPATAAAGDADRLVLDPPLSDVTGIKIVSGITSVGASAGPDADASLELREVRAWADPVGAAQGPLRDLSVTARADLRWVGTEPADWPPVSRAPAAAIDGATDTAAATTKQHGAWWRMDFGAERVLRHVVYYSSPAYPGTFFYTPPGQGCPPIPLCGDTYGTCARRSLGIELFALDAQGAPLGNALSVLAGLPSQSLPLSAAAHGFEAYKATGGSTPTPSCLTGYGHTSLVNVVEARVFGYLGADPPSPLNYALLGQGGVGSLSPAEASGLLTAERALDGWELDYAGTGGTGAQELAVALRRPVLLTRVRVASAAGSDPTGALLEAQVDGGAWVPVATLTADDDQSFDLSGDRLISALRLRHDGVALRVRELEALALPRY